MADIVENVVPTAMPPDGLSVPNQDPIPDTEDSVAATDGDDPKFCRVCRCNDGDEILYAPCMCKGSISYVHQSCLLQWLEVSGKKSCELCSYPYHFSPLYSEDTPRKLTVTEFFQIACLKVLNTVPIVLRYVLVAAVWLLGVPFATCWIFRLWMLRSNLGLAEDDTYFQTDILLADLLAGAFICAVACVVALATFRFVKHAARATVTLEQCPR